MTWKEFKEEIEKELEDQYKFSNEIKIGYINVDATRVLKEIRIEIINAMLFITPI